MTQAAKTWKTTLSGKDGEASFTRWGPARTKAIAATLARREMALAWRTVARVTGAPQIPPRGLASKAESFETSSDAGPCHGWRLGKAMAAGLAARAEGPARDPRLRDGQDALDAAAARVARAHPGKTGWEEGRPPTAFLTLDPAQDGSPLGARILTGAFSTAGAGADYFALDRLGALALLATGASVTALREMGLAIPGETFVSALEPCRSATLSAFLRKDAERLARADEETLKTTFARLTGTQCKDIQSC